MKRVAGESIIFLMIGVFWSSVSQGTCGQTPTRPTPIESSAQSQPTFEVATIKPADGSGLLGFLSYPDGRIVVGNASVKTLVSYAFDVQDFQVVGQPRWAEAARYNVVALEPKESNAGGQPTQRATPNEKERKMLQALLEERFGLKAHQEYKQGPAYILSKGKKKLTLQDAKYKDSDARATFLMTRGGIADGTALGNNLTMKFLAALLSPLLERPVLDQTGLKGSYDFRLGPDDPTNQDLTAAIIDDMDRLGLKLSAGKGPIEMIAIDHVNKPTEN